MNKLDKQILTYNMYHINVLCNFFYADVYIFRITFKFTSNENIKMGSTKKVCEHFSKYYVIFQNLIFYD